MTKSRTHRHSAIPVSSLVHASEITSNGPKTPEGRCLKCTTISPRPSEFKAFHERFAKDDKPPVGHGMEIDELPVIAGLGKTQLIELTSLLLHCISETDDVRVPKGTSYTEEAETLWRPTFGQHDIAMEYLLKGTHIELHEVCGALDYVLRFRQANPSIPASEAGFRWFVLALRLYRKFERDQYNIARSTWAMMLDVSVQEFGSMETSFFLAIGGECWVQKERIELWIAELQSLKDATAGLQMEQKRYRTILPAIKPSAPSPPPTPRPATVVANSATPSIHQSHAQTGQRFNPVDLTGNPMRAEARHVHPTPRSGYASHMPLTDRDFANTFDRNNILLSRPGSFHGMRSHHASEAFARQLPPMVTPERATHPVLGDSGYYTFERPPHLPGRLPPFAEFCRDIQPVSGTASQLTFQHNTVSGRRFTAEGMYVQQRNGIGPNQSTREGVMLWSSGAVPAPPRQAMLSTSQLALRTDFHPSNGWSYRSHPYAHVSEEHRASGPAMGYRPLNRQSRFFPD